MAVGAHGLIVEVHPNPDAALSDGPQSLTLESFRAMMDGLRGLSEPLGKVVAPSVTAVPAAFAEAAV
jgi:3-deoxy-7-phosphoheptulonate synthase